MIMTIKELLIEADAIQVGVVESDWQRVISWRPPAGGKRLSRRIIARR
jgi:hypothetical protein